MRPQLAFASLLVVVLLVGVLDQGQQHGRAVWKVQVQRLARDAGSGGGRAPLIDSKLDDLRFVLFAVVVDHVKLSLLDGKPDRRIDYQIHRL